MSSIVSKMFQFIRIGSNNLQLFCCRRQFLKRGSPFTKDISKYENINLPLADIRVAMKSTATPKGELSPRGQRILFVFCFIGTACLGLFGIDKFQTYLNNRDMKHALKKDDTDYGILSGQAK